MNPASPSYQALAAGYEATFNAANSATVTAALSSVSTVFASVLTLWILVTGGIMLSGRMSAGEGMGRIVRAVIVAAALVPAHYAAWVTDALTTQIPAFVAQAAGQGHGVVDAGVFDQLNAGVVRLSALNDAVTGTFDVPDKIRNALVTMACQIVILLSFVIYFCAKLGLGLLVTLGPIVLPMLLFKTTSGVAERYLGKVIDYTLLLFLVLVVVNVVAAQDAALIASAVPAHAGNIPEMIGALFQVALCFAGGLALLVLLPSMASFMGGGVGASAGPAIAIMMRSAGRIAG